MKKLMMALAVPALLAGCSDKKTPKTGDSEGLAGLFWQQSANVISVRTFDDQPIKNAQILIGDALNSPFSGNFLTTDANGQVEIPAGWNTGMAVTVQAPGFIRSTYMNQEPGALTFKLRPSVTTTQYEVKGVTSGLPVQDKDGYVDFGLVMPAFSKMALLSFDINNVISPQSDRIEAMGQDIDVPANISLPRQSEKYALFTITLDKPNYRIYYGNTGVNRVFAARGRFPFKSTVDALRGGAEFYELINSFTISGGAVRSSEVPPEPCLPSGFRRSSLPSAFCRLELSHSAIEAVSYAQASSEHKLPIVGSGLSLLQSLEQLPLPWKGQSKSQSG